MYWQCQPVTSSTSVSTTATMTTAAPISSASLIGLAALMLRKGKKYFGVAAEQNTLTVTQDYNIILANFNEITPPNAMLWSVTEPKQNTFNFASADYVVNWGQTHGMLIRGYTLVWHSNLPSWVSALSTPAALTSAIQNHITVEVGRYKGKLFAWDVVNEVSSLQPAHP